MIDKIKLQEKLTDGFIIREHQIMQPAMTITPFSEAKERYMNDSIFNARVRYIVSAVLCIVDECEVEE